MRGATFYDNLYVLHFPSNDVDIDGHGRYYPLYILFGSLICKANILQLTLNDILYINYTFSLFYQLL